MNNEPNMDEWLKENFNRFSPEAPDVWQGISKGIQSAQAAQSGAGLTAAAKGSAMVVKIISAVVAVAGLTTAVVLYTQSEQKPEATTPSQTEQTVMENQVPEQPTLSEQTITPIIEAAPISAQPTKRNDKGNETFVANTQSKSAERQNVVSEPQSIPSTGSIKDNSTTVTTPVEQPAPTVVTPQPKPEQNQVMPSKAEAPKQVVETNDTPPQAKLPYNPKEGETGFDKSNIPNAFSPNDDGKNDRFVIEITQETLYHLIITDASGRMVFESFDKTNTWDGKDQRTGVQCQSGDYRWVFQYQFKESDKQRTTTGILRLIN